MIDLDRVSDLELLRQVAKVQDVEIRRLHEKLEQVTRELIAAKGGDASAVEAQLRLLQKELEEAYRRAGSTRSERRRRDHSGDPQKERAPQKGHPPREQPNLPIVPVDHHLDEADMKCPKCDGYLEAWKDEFEESEEIDVVEVEYVLKKHRRQKYRCRCGGCVETAAGPVKLVPGGRYSLDFAIHVAIAKWCDHLPLERQVRRMHRSGLEIDSQTLWDQTWALSRCFRAAIKELHAYLLSKQVLIADESHWPLIGVQARKSKNWFTWALVSDDAVLYTILDSRSNDAARIVLDNFTGILLVDGYIVYESQAKELGFTVANDWCHPRRHFIEAEASAPDEAREFIADIGKLFLIEREIAAEAEGLVATEALALRARHREERSKPVVEAIGQRAAEIRAFRESPIAKAVKYLENRWQGLIRFLRDPRIPITSNAAERALRCSVLGRNNFFGSRSERGIETAGMFYSLIGSAQLNGLEPRAYLKLAAEAHLRGERVPLPHEIARANSAN